jgi:hypothetical protein
LFALDNGLAICACADTIRLSRGREFVFNLLTTLTNIWQHILCRHGVEPPPFAMGVLFIGHFAGLASGPPFAELKRAFGRGGYIPEWRLPGTAARQFATHCRPKRARRMLRLIFRERTMGEELGETSPPPSIGLRRRFWRGACGIVAGVTSGTVLGIGIVAGPAAVYHDVTRAINFLLHFIVSDPITESISDSLDETAWEVALIYSISVGAVAVAVPIWIGLGWLRRNTIIDALLLGAALGGAVGYFIVNGGPMGALKFGAVGACAGLTSWVVSHRGLTRRSAHP